MGWELVYEVEWELGRRSSRTWGGSWWTRFGRNLGGNLPLVNGQSELDKSKY